MGCDDEPLAREGLLAQPPNEQDVELAVQVLARHVPEHWPYGVRCRNCHWPYPCAANRLANAVLVRAGRLDHAVELPPVAPTTGASGYTEPDGPPG